jgi:hypothetical protein
MTYTELKAAIIAYTENQEFSATNLATFVSQAEQRIYNTVQVANLRKNMTGSLVAGNQYLSCPDDFLSTYSLAVYPYNTPTATGSSGASTIVVSSASNLATGQYVTGNGIGTGAYITAINGTTLTLSVVNAGAVTGTMTIQGDYQYLLNKDVNFIREVYPASGYRAEPKYYAIFGPKSTDVNELTLIVGPTPDQAYRAELHFYYYPESITTVASGRTWLSDNFDSVLLYGSLVEAYTFMKGEQDMMALYNNKYQEALGLFKNLGDAKQRGDAYRDGQVKLQVR